MCPAADHRSGSQAGPVYTLPHSFPKLQEIQLGSLSIILTYFTVKTLPLILGNQTEATKTNFSYFIVVENKLKITVQWLLTETEVSLTLKSKVTRIFIAWGVNKVITIILTYHTVLTFWNTCYLKNHP